LVEQTHAKRTLGNFGTVWSIIVKGWGDVADCTNLAQDLLHWQAFVNT